MTSAPATIVLGGGCFWCLEAVYQMVAGVLKVQSGYAGGTVADPSYEAVCQGTTGHAEVVQVTFDPASVSLPQLLEIFWTIHDPTTPNRQGNDIGSQYRSIILYQSAEEKVVAEQSRDAAQTVWDQPIVTEITPLKAFYPAEAEHDDYYRRNRSRPYCQIVINPKLAKLRRSFAGRLKPAS